METVIYVLCILGLISVIGPLFLVALGVVFGIVEQVFKALFSVGGGGPRADLRGTFGDAEVYETMARMGEIPAERKRSDIDKEVAFLEDRIRLLKTKQSW